MKKLLDILMVTLAGALVIFVILMLGSMVYLSWAS